MTANNVNEVFFRLYIGNDKIASDSNWLNENGITHIINATHELPNYFQTKLHYLKLNLEDKHEKEDLLRVLEPSFRYINNILAFSKDAKILVHCYAGISRSASIVIYYLMRKYGWSYDKAYKYLKSKRNIISPNPWYEFQLKDNEKIING